MDSLALVYQPCNRVGSNVPLLPNVKFIDMKPGVKSFYDAQVSESDDDQKVLKFLERYSKAILIGEGTESVYNEVKIA